LRNPEGKSANERPKQGISYEAHRQLLPLNLSVRQKVCKMMLRIEWVIKPKLDIEGGGNTRRPAILKRGLAMKYFPNKI